MKNIVSYVSSCNDGMNAYISSPKTSDLFNDLNTKTQMGNRMSHQHFGDLPHPTPLPATPTGFGTSEIFPFLFASSFQQPRRPVLHLFTWRSSRLYMLDYGRRAVYRLWIRIKGNPRILTWRDINYRRIPLNRLKHG